MSTVRRFLERPEVEPHIARVLRARAVRESVRFFARDARGHGRFTYTVRKTGQAVSLEHGTSDIPTLDQAYHQDAYAPPPVAEAALRGLGHPLRALDLGANIGMFSVWLGGRYELGHVTAVEPLPRNVAVLERNLAQTLAPGTFVVLPAAAGTQEGTVRFGGGDAATGRIRDDDSGVDVRLVDVFAMLDDVDLLKIDIEGAEWPLVADPRFLEITVPIVMFEHHPYGAPGEPATAAERALSDAGYEIERTIGDPDGTGVVWGVKRTAA